MKSAALLLALAALSARPQSPESNQTESSQHKVDRIFAAFTTHTPGCAVGVSDHGTVALRAGYGMADLERAVPVTPDTVFESGSVAKQFTAMAVLLLAKQGKISLDDPMRKYLPELPDYGTPLTIRHVLSHLSGLREWRLVATFSGKPEGTYILDNHDLLTFAGMQRALNFDPGTAYSYTNTGFNIMTILIERALGNGKTFQDFTREQIFQPLNMTHTRWRDDYRTVVPNRALAYVSAPGGWIQDTPVENIIGAGGLLSTVGDWLLWNENFTTAKVGGPEVVKLQQTPATLRNGKTISYAAGLTVGAFDGFREVSHGGSTGGYRTWIARYPEKSVSVAVMCNSPMANPTQLGRETARLWTGGVAAPKPAPFPMDAAAQSKLTGMYRRLHDNTVVELHMKDGGLMLDRVSLTASGKDEFAAGERKFVFAGGSFKEVTPDGDIAYERVEPAHPSAADLASLAGQYSSTETGTTLTVAVKASDLTLAIGSNASNIPIRLRPTFRDAFMMEGAGGASIVFHRDPSGMVTALSAADDRVWDLRFMRTAAAQAAAAAPAQNPAILGENTIKVSDHTWAIMGFPNIGIVVGSNATLIVDTGLGPRNGATIARVAKRLAPANKLYLTTTHFHPEHAAGDAGFPPGTILIRNRVQQEDMDEHGMEMIQTFSSRNAQYKELLAGVTPRKPDEIYETERRVDLGGGVSARLLYFGPAHTAGDELIFVEPDRTLISGDVVQNKVVPNIVGVGGTPATWIAVLDKTEKLGALHVLPDHSPIGDGSLVAKEKAFIVDLRTRALALKRQGVSADEAGTRLTADFKSKYADWNINTVANFVKSVYAE